MDLALGKEVSDSWRIHGGVVGSEIRPRILTLEWSEEQANAHRAQRWAFYLGLGAARAQEGQLKAPHRISGDGAGVVPTTAAPPARGRRRERSGGRRGRPRRSRRIPSRNGHGSRRWRGPRGGAPSLS